MEIFRFRPQPTGMQPTAETSAARAVRTVEKVTIPPHIAAAFLELAKSQKGHVQAKNKATCAFLIDLCAGNPPAHPNAGQVRAAVFLRDYGAAKTFASLKTKKRTGRKGSADNFVGWTPTAQQQYEFTSLVMHANALIDPSRLSMVRGVMLVCGGMSAAQAGEEVDISGHSILTNWRRINYFTPEGAHYYFTLPSLPSIGDREELENYHLKRLEQGNLPKPPVRRILATYGEPGRVGEVSTTPPGAQNPADPKSPDIGALYLPSPVTPSAFANRPVVPAPQSPPSYMSPRMVMARGVASAPQSSLSPVPPKVGTARGYLASPDASPQASPSQVVAHTVVAERATSAPQATVSAGGPKSPPALSPPPPPPLPANASLGDADSLFADALWYESNF